MKEIRGETLRAMMADEGWQTEVCWACGVNGEMMAEALAAYLDILREQVDRWGKHRGEVSLLMARARDEYRERMILDLLEIPEHYRRGFWQSCRKAMSGAGSRLGLTGELSFGEGKDRAWETFERLVRAVERHWDLMTHPTSIFEGPTSVYVDMVHAVEELGDPEEVFAAAFAPWFGADFGRTLCRRGRELTVLIRGLREGSKRECRTQAEEVILRLDALRAGFVRELTECIPEGLPGFLTERMSGPEVEPEK